MYLIKPKADTWKYY